MNGLKMTNKPVKEFKELQDEQAKVENDCDEDRD
jgi:hypothetical protein